MDLFYLSPNPYGGWVTYTAHLIDALKSVGYAPELFKIRPRSERSKRPFGYGVEYRNISLEEALSRKGPKLVVAAAKNFSAETEALYAAGAGLVVHDPTELKNLPDLKDGERTVVIRKVGMTFLPKARFIRHPYTQNEVAGQKTKHAVSICRIDFDKHTDILLDANRLLPEDRKIDIRGFENRIYTRFKIVPNYPEWVQSQAAYDRTKTAAFDLLAQSRFAVDMSRIKGDGGGTQYSFLEAMDAGAVNIIHRHWIRDDDDMVENRNCLVVENAHHLAETLNTDHSKDQISEMRAEGLFQLSKHAPHVIGPEYKAFVESL